MELTSSMVSQFPRSNRAEYKVSQSRLDRNGNLNQNGLSSSRMECGDDLSTDDKESVSISLLHKIIGPPIIRPLQGISLGSLILSLIILSFTLLLVIFDKINLTFKYVEEDLSDFESKLKFTLRFWILPTTWLLHSLLVVILRRFRTIAWDPMAGNDHLTEVDQRLLQNTIEQTLLSVLSQFMILGVMTANETLKVIPFINIWFVIGRFLFWAGYPRYRTFGFCFSMVPSFFSIKLVWFRVLGIEDWIKETFFQWTQQQDNDVRPTIYWSTFRSSQWRYKFWKCKCFTI